MPPRAGGPMNWRLLTCLSNIYVVALRIMDVQFFQYWHAAYSDTTIDSAVDTLVEYDCGVSF
jgi:hypothetical protein